MGGWCGYGPQKPVPEVSHERRYPSPVPTPSVSSAPWSAGASGFLILTLFAVMAAIVVVASGIFAGMSAEVVQRTGDVVELTGEEPHVLRRRALDAALGGRQLHRCRPGWDRCSRPMIGIGVAERTGFISMGLKVLVTYGCRMRVLTATVVFAGVMSSMAADAGYVVTHHSTPAEVLLFAKHRPTPPRGPGGGLRRCVRRLLGQPAHHRARPHALRAHPAGGPVSGPRLLGEPGLPLLAFMVASTVLSARWSAPSSSHRIIEPGAGRVGPLHEGRLGRRDRTPRPCSGGKGQGLRHLRGRGPRGRHRPDDAGLHRCAAAQRGGGRASLPWCCTPSSSRLRSW